MINGSFKQSAFDKEKLKQFAEGLQEAGLPVQIRWKKGRKEVPEEKAVAFSLYLEGLSIFTQTGKNGIVKLDKLSKQEKQLLLKEMKRYNFYTDPGFGLGIALTVLFVLIEWLIMWANADKMPWIVPFLSIASLLALQWLLVSWFYCQGKLQKGAYQVSMVFGLIGYIGTVAWSLLLLPMIKTFNQYYLTNEIKQMEEENKKRI